MWPHQTSTPVVYRYKRFNLKVKTQWIKADKQGLQLRSTRSCLRVPTLSSCHPTSKAYFTRMSLQRGRVWSRCIRLKEARIKTCKQRRWWRSTANKALRALPSQRPPSSKCRSIPLWAVQCSITTIPRATITTIQLQILTKVWQICSWRSIILPSHEKMRHQITKKEASNLSKPR